MLPHELSCHKGRLLLSVLMLKDAGRNCYAVPSVDRVVSHESRHFADDGHKALLGHLRHLLGVGHVLEAPHCNIHSFSLPPCILVLVVQNAADGTRQTDTSLVDAL